MYTHMHANTEHCDSEKGFALIIAIIVLAILGVMGLSAMDVADLNMLIAANDRDAREAFFNADSGVNIGHTMIEKRPDDFTVASNQTIDPNSTLGADVMTSVIENYDIQQKLAGFNFSFGTANEGPGKTPPKLNALVIQAHGEAQRNSRADIDLGWLHVGHY